MDSSEVEHMNKWKWKDAFIFWLIVSILIFGLYGAKSYADEEQISQEHTYILEYSINGELHQMEFTPVTVYMQSGNHNYVRYVCDNYVIIASSSGVTYKDYTNDTYEVYNPAQVYLKK
jgi:hypothetical protein